MRALLLAAGLGTRLKPFTFLRAKASLPLLGIPFIHYPLHFLKSNGIHDVVINLHAHPESVKEAVAGSPGANVEYSQEPEILGTAGAMKKASRMLADDPFVVLNGDMLTAIPVEKVLEQHRQTNADVTLVVMKDDAYMRYSGVYFEGTDPIRLSGIKEGRGEKYHYTGLQIVSRRVLSLIPENRPSEIFRDIYPELIAAGTVYGYVYEGLWLEIGTLKEYLQTSLRLIDEPLPEMLRPPGMKARLLSPAASIADGAKVTDSIVMEGAIIKDGLDIKRCIVGKDVSVQKNWEGVALARGFLPWYIFNDKQN